MATKLLKATKEEIKTFVKKTSFFTLDDETDNSLNFSTREHCTPDSDEASPKDMEAARKVVRDLKKKYSNINYEIDTCDEWVFLIFRV